MPRAARSMGPAEMALTRIPCRQIGGQVAHRGLESRFGHAHHVVARHHLLRAQICKRDDAATVQHQRSRGPRQRDNE